MKKKLLLTAVITILICLTSICVSAGTYGNLTYEISNGEVTITGCNESATSVTIPSSISGYPVTSIGDAAFINCYSLTSITIPDSVTSIGNDAFYYCESLTFITIPDSVTSIGEEAFEYCYNLAEIDVNSNNKNYASVNGVLFNKDKTTIVCYPRGKKATLYAIPNSVTSIGSSAFFGCSSLTSITIPNSVTSIGSSAFEDCSSLTSITIPDRVTSIGDWVFSGCKSLTSITIPDRVTNIGYRAFNGCKSLTSITIPDRVTSIGNWAFSSCSSLTSITIPDSVTSIGLYAFSGCDNLTIYCKSGSYAETYAKKQGYKFELINITDEEDTVIVEENIGKPGINLLTGTTSTYGFNAAGYHHGIIIPREEGVVADPDNASNSVLWIGDQNFSNIGVTPIPDSSTDYYYPLAKGKTFENERVFRYSFDLKGTASASPVFLMSGIGNASPGWKEIARFNVTDGMNWVKKNGTFTYAQAISSLGTFVMCFYNGEAPDGEFYIDNLEIIPDYKVTYYAPDGKTVVKSEYVDGKATAYSLDEEIVAMYADKYLFLGFKFKGDDDSNLIEDEIALANQDIDIVPVFNTDIFTPDYIVAIEGTKTTITAKYEGEWSVDDETLASIEGDGSSAVITSKGYAGTLGITIVSDEDPSVTETVYIRLRNGSNFKPGVNMLTGTDEPFGFEESKDEVMMSITLPRNASLDVIPTGVGNDSKYGIKMYHTGSGGQQFPQLVFPQFRFGNVEYERPHLVSYDWQGRYGNVWLLGDKGNATLTSPMAAPAGGSTSATFVHVDYAWTQTNKNRFCFQAGLDPVMSTMPLYIDNLSIVPYYKVSFADATGAELSYEYVSPLNAIYTIPKDKFEALDATVYAGFALEGTKSIVTEVVLTDEDVILVPIPNGDRIMYDANGGENAPGFQIVNDGEYVVISGQIPTRTHYTFLGWSTAVNGEVEFLPGDEITIEESITLYAVWDPEKFQVTYDSNGGNNAPANQTKNYGEDLILTNDIPTRVGYSFSCWSTNAYGENKQTLSVDGLESSHSYANSANQTWTISSPGAESITLTFDRNTEFESNYDFLHVYDCNGQLFNKYSGTTLSGKSITVQGDSVRLNLTSDSSINKWGFKVTSAIASFSATTYAPGDTYTKDESITLYALWDVAPIVITYDANGGENAPEEQSKDHGVKVYLSEQEPTRENYYFIGWATSPDGEPEYYPGSSYVKNEDLTLYAVWADHFKGECCDNHSWYLDNNGTLTISGTGDMDNNCYHGWRDYSIIKNATKAVIETGITNIGNSCFSDMKNLVSVEIANSVTNIGNYAFSDCSSLSSITIPDSVTNIGTNAFNDCVGLTSVDLPYGMQFIPEGLFANLENLSEITIPNSVKSIECAAFSNCTSLKNITIPDSVAYIGYEAFSNCSELTSISLGSSVVFVDSPFYGCENLENITVSDSIIYFSVAGIEDTAWYEKQPDGYLYLGDMLLGYKGDYPEEETTFTVKDGTRVISEINLPETVRKINIPESVKYIHYNNICNTEWYNNQPYGAVYLGKVLIGYKMSDEDWETEGLSVTIKEGTTCIAECVFDGVQLEKLTMPDSVQCISQSQGLNDLCVCETNFSKNLKVLRGSISCYDHYPEKNNPIVLPQELQVVSDGFENVAVVVPESVAHLYPQMNGEFYYVREGSYAGKRLQHACKELMGNGIGVTESDYYSYYYNIKYDANGGTNAPQSHYKLGNNDAKISGTIPTKNGSTFRGWSTTKGGSTIDYTPGISYNNNEDITLYAVWRTETYFITYDANGGDGAPNMQIKADGIAITLDNTKPQRTGYTFLGWATSNDANEAAYQPGQQYVENGDVILYAVWKPNSYTVMFNANGGTDAPDSQEKLHDISITMSTKAPQRPGYEFKGWSTVKNGTVEYNPGDIYDANESVTLYAVWRIDVYIVSYNANGGVGEPDFQTKPYGSDIVLSSIIPTRAGHEFAGWATSANAVKAEYMPGDKYTANEDTVLFAIWKVVCGTKTTVSKYSAYSICNVTLNSIPNKSNLVIAGYKSDRLVHYEERPVTQTSEMFAIMKDIDTVKVFVFKEPSSLIPITECETIEI